MGPSRGLSDTQCAMTSVSTTNDCITAAGREPASFWIGVGIKMGCIKKTMYYLNIILLTTMLTGRALTGECYSD